MSYIFIPRRSRGLTQIFYLFDLRKSPQSAGNIKKLTSNNVIHFYFPQITLINADYFIWNLTKTVAMFTYKLINNNFHFRF